MIDTNDAAFQDGNTTPAETQIRVTEKVKRKGKAQIAKKNNMLEKLSIQYVPIDSVHPNRWNPNRQGDHEHELLIKSMSEDGFTQPVVCFKNEDGVVTIADGEHRWRAAYALGYKEIPVVITPMNEEQARIATLRHNRAKGSEDAGLTAEMIRDFEKLNILDWAQDSLMMDDSEIQKMLEDIPAPEALAGDDWTEAWEPGEMSAAQEEAKDVTRTIESGGGQVMAAASIAAIERQREREKKLAEAKTAEERQSLKKDNDIFRLYLTFTGDQAEEVKEVLGNQAAERILDMCRKYRDDYLSEEEDNGEES